MTETHFFILLTLSIILALLLLHRQDRNSSGCIPLAKDFREEFLAHTLTA